MDNFKDLLFPNLWNLETVGVLTVVSFAFALASLVVTPWIIVRLPVNYLQTPKPHLFQRLNHRTPVLSLAVIAKNLVGVILVLAGILMLVLPGQGLLTMLVGLLLMDFPGKGKFETYLLTRPKILEGVQWLRRRYGRPELRA